MGISKIKPLTSQYHSVGGSRGRGLLCLAPQLVLTWNVNRYKFCNAINFVPPRTKSWRRHCRRQLHGLPHTWRHKACWHLVLWVQRNYMKHVYPMLRLCVHRAGSWRQATPTRPLHTAGELWLVGLWICRTRQRGVNRDIFDLRRVLTRPVRKLSLKTMCSIWLASARVDARSRKAPLASWSFYLFFDFQTFITPE